MEFLELLWVFPEKVYEATGKRGCFILLLIFFIVVGIAVLKFINP